MTNNLIKDPYLNEMEYIYRFMEFSFDKIDKYIKEVFGAECSLLKVSTLSGAVYESGEIKGYGYGEPLLLEVKCREFISKYVLNTLRMDHFGHEYISDRAGILIWNHIAYNSLPRHVKSVDLGYIDREGGIHSIDTPIEFIQLVEYVEGIEYFHDLNRIGESGEATDLDIKRVYALADYIAEVHSVKKDDPMLYRRRIRELVGHGEALMGLIDSYRGDEDFLEPNELKDIELKAVEWRWRIRDLSHRLSQVHGDFHPWNIKFREDTDFTVLDRSRGEWGEPADDVAAMTINYIFFSLMYYEDFRDPFKKLWTIFFERYLSKTGDEEILEVIQPFYAWRGLVIANPIWYPNLKYNIRRTIFNFIHNVLKEDYFNYKKVASLLK